MLNENIKVKGDGPYHAFGYLCLISDPINLAEWSKKKTIAILQISGQSIHRLENLNTKRLHNISLRSIGSIGAKVLVKLQANLLRSRIIVSLPFLLNVRVQVLSKSIAMRKHACAKRCNITP